MRNKLLCVAVVAALIFGLVGGASAGDFDSILRDSESGDIWSADYYNGDLYIANFSNDYVERYDSQFNRQEQLFNPDMYFAGMEVRNGDFWLAERYDNSLFKFDSNGNELNQVNLTNIQSEIRGIEYYSGSWYVLDRDYGVREYDSNFNYVGDVYIDQNKGSTANGWWGLDEKNGYLYASYKKNVDKISPSGSLQNNYNLSSQLSSYSAGSIFALAMDTGSSQIVTGHYNDGHLFGWEGVFNKAPQFNSTNVDPDSPLIGENVSYGAEVFDSDGSISYTNLTVQYGGSTVVVDEQRTGTTSPVWNDVFTPQTGNKWLNTTLSVVDDKGAVTNTEINRYLEDTPPELNIVLPDNTTYGTPDVDYKVELLDDNDSRPNETSTCTVYNDGNTVNTFTSDEANAPQTFTGTVAGLTQGTYTFNATCTENDDSQTTSKKLTYSVENGPPSIDSFTTTPTTWNKGDLIDVSYDVTDGFDNVTWVKLTAYYDSSVKQTQNTSYSSTSVSDTINDLFEVTYIGNYSLKIETSDEIGQVSTQWINQSVPDIYPPTTELNTSERIFYSDNVPLALNSTDDESMVQNITYSIDGGTTTTVTGDFAEFTLNGYGSYILEWYAYDNQGNREANKTATITLEQLQADFFYQPSTPYIDETITFDGSISGGNVTQYEWDWTSDGTYDQTGETATHSYSQPGVYTVTLKTTDADGNTDTYSEDVEILYESANKSLVKQCSAESFCFKDNTSYTTTNPVTVSGSLTELDGNQSFTYKVNASGIEGDYDFYGFANSTADRLDRTYYSTIETVTIAGNETNVPPTADFTVDLSGLTANVDASPSSDVDGTITDYRWDWTNDGSFEATGLTQSHTYSSDGTYTIRLQVEDNNQSTSETTATIQVSEDSGGGGGGGGDEPVDDEPTDNETTISSDGATGTLLSPHSGARYFDNTFTVSEGQQQIVNIAGEDQSFETVNVTGSTTANVKVNGIQSQVSEMDEFEFLEKASGFTGSTLTIGEKTVIVSDIIEFNESLGAVRFSFKDDSNNYEPYISYSYLVNDTANFTTQVRKAGPFNDWQNISTNEVLQPTNRTLANDLANIGSEGIFETRLAVQANGSTNYTAPIGFYTGDTPAIEILRPPQSTEFKRPPTAYVEVPLDYRFQVISGSNVTGIGQYYFRTSDGEIYSIVEQKNVVQEEQDSFFEDLADAFGVTIEEAYGEAFSWLVPTEPDNYYVNTTMQVGGYGEYSGYVNASINTSSGEVKNLNSLPRTIQVISQSANDYIDDNKESTVVNQAEANINESFSVDQDGDGVAEDVTVGTLVTALDKPEDNATVKIQKLDSESINFKFFAMNVNGTAVVNKTFVLQGDNQTLRKPLPPTSNSYDFDITPAEYGQSWSNTNYSYHIKYFEPGTNNTLLYSSETGGAVNTFEVVQTAPDGITDYWRFQAQKYKEDIAELLNIDVFVIGTLATLIIVAAASLPFYVKKNPELAKIVAVVTYAATAYLYITPSFWTIAIGIMALLLIAGWITKKIAGGG